ncbi:TonB-dependent receptor [Vandammella animalimorsus]|uniref:TonB-dependent receptor n=1 Tax=Vandammella animalimorsus TaxID=2029117 RepID=A0A2A2T3J0_9BURK|nr:TonB-dependent receptor [Vandammella animalimorsus]PAX16055.1 TonB-dependent receptor [Vandammella animalimorsus]PAX20251.1 TonB-dependent receptor [Vandammella animalimorsus]
MIRNGNRRQRALPWRTWALVCAVGPLASLGASAQQAAITPVVQAQQVQQAQDVELDEVVISAAGYEQALAEAPATISVITAQDLQGKYYRDVSDALQDVPGLSVEGGASRRLESTSITIRGMGESYVLFLVDGKPLGDSAEAYYNGFGGATKINQLPPMSAIERIEVIRGPMSSLYGSSALGGVINIITKKQGMQWSGSLTVDTVQQQAGQAGDSWQAAYYLSGPLSERVGLTLSGSKFRRAEDKVQDGWAKKDREHATARLHWALSQAQSLELEAGLSRNENLRTQARSGVDQDMSNRRPQWALTHELRWGQGMSTRSFATHEKVSVRNGGNRSSYEMASLNSKTVVPLARHMLTVGADVKQEKTRHMASRFPGSIKTNLSRWQAALFAEDEFALGDALSLTGGLRLDRNQHYGTEITPRLYAVYRLGGQWSLKGGMGGGYKTPSLKQADDNIVEIAARGAAWDKGNTQLKPERSANYELGAVWADGPRSLGITYYNTRFKDKISTTRICNSPANAPNCHYNGEVRQRINQYINLDRAKLQGLELAAKAPLGPVLLKASYTWSDSEITRGANLGKPLNNLPRHMLNLGADWSVNTHWTVWGKAKYKGKTLEDGQNQYPAYTLVDVGMAYDIGAQWQVFGGIYNLLDKQITRDVFGKSLDGRRWHIGVTAQF